MVWVVPLSEWGLTPHPRLQRSTTHKHLEFDKEPKDFSSKIPDQSLYNSCSLAPRWTTVHFDRNQLSPLSIGFLPLFPSQKNTCT